MIITRTPLRISFLGGGTDYPAWFREHGGAVLSTTIDKYIYVSVRELPPFFEHKHRCVWSQIENVNNIDDIHNNVMRECLRYMGIGCGVAINHDGDLPARTGMGSSSAFTVGLLNALHILQGTHETSICLAEEATHVEQDLIKDSVGNQDQVAAAYGGLNFIEFAPNGIKCSPLNISPERRKLFESHLMLVFTGFPHMASDVAGTYEFKPDLKDMMKLTREGKTILENGHIRDFGSLLHDGWVLKCCLSPDICTPFTSYLYDKALQAGALGGKLLGAGGGGFLLLFVEPEKQESVRQALKGLLFVPFHFHDKGSEVIMNGNP